MFWTYEGCIEAEMVMFEGIIIPIPWLRGMRQRKG